MLGITIDPARMVLDIITQHGGWYFGDGMSVGIQEGDPNPQRLTYDDSTIL